MNVYKISLPDADSGSEAWIPMTGLFEMPRFFCKRCGVPGSAIGGWYASLELKYPEHITFDMNNLPEEVGSREEYLAIRDQVRKASGTERPFYQGSVIGAKPIKVANRSKSIDGLTAKKLQQGVDFISFSYGYAVSDRIATVLRESGLNFPLTPIVLETEKKTYTNYFVMELEPVLTWAEEDYAKFQTALCPDCGSFTMGITKGSYKPKKLSKDVFKQEMTVVYAHECISVLLSEPLRDRLEAINPQGASFYKYGEVA